MQDNTVLILGAGSSMEYGFPSGSQLIKEICKDFDPKNNNDSFYLASLIYPFFNEDNTKHEKYFEAKDLIADFINRLQDAKPISMDDFMHCTTKAKPEFNIIGKMLILLTILKYESKYDHRKMNGWYNDLFNKIQNKSLDEPDIKELKTNFFSIITFNYDRSLELFLFYTISANYPSANKQEICEVIKSLNIKHVYGQIGEFPDFYFDVDKDSIAYKKEIDLKTLKSEIDFSYLKKKVPIHEIVVLFSNGFSYKLVADFKKVLESSQSIKTYREEDIPESDISKYQEILRKADRIFFLGFGYHEQNLKILGLDNILERQRIYGTTYRCGKAEVEGIKGLLRKSYNKNFAHINYGGINHEYNEYEIEKYFKEVEML